MTHNPMANASDIADPCTPRRRLSPDAATLLRQARVARGWSYRTAGRRLGVAFGYLAELEAGRRVPSTAMAETLISGYGLEGADARLLRLVAVPGVGRDRPSLRTFDRQKGRTP